MFFDALDKVDRGLVVCVFDGTDRLQHTFWRDIDQEHPAHPEEARQSQRRVIEDQYRRMDDLVGRTMARCRGEDARLLVISDHGFCAFRRGVDLNRWLEESGYLKLHAGRRGEEYLAGVDWPHTQAFAVGLAGIYINVRGKYAQGIVDPQGEADRIAAEIAQRLAALVDPQTGQCAVKRVYRASEVYVGPYKDRSPELIVGYQRGYRASWETAVGRTTEHVFYSNTKPWSGDHCIDRSLVPGVLFCDRPVEAEDPRLIDIAPTVLALFGVPVPEYMDGRALPVGETANDSSSGQNGDLPWVI
jgi:predicted AlkP superfamily phosphohydrolase/phosphomutase